MVSTAAGLWELDCSMDLPATVLCGAAATAAVFAYTSCATNARKLLYCCLRRVAKKREQPDKCALHKHEKKSCFSKILSSYFEDSSKLFFEL